MELKVIEDKKTKFVFDLLGVDHTFCNILREELWQDEATQLATYSIDHPLVGKPRFVLETTKKEPRVVLKEAIARLKKTSSDFKKKVEKALA